MFTFIVGLHVICEIQSLEDIFRVNLVPGLVGHNQHLASFFKGLESCNVLVGQGREASSGFRGLSVYIEFLYLLLLKIQEKEDKAVTKKPIEGLGR